MPPNIDDVRRLPRLYENVVPESWLDEYGHMNVRYYMEMWGKGAGAFMRELGLDFKDAAKRDVGYWLLRQVLDYLAEVRVGETIAVYGRVIDRTEKMLHNKYWLINDTRTRIAATSEVLVGRADLTIRRLAPFPPAEIVLVDEQLASFNALDWDPMPSGAIELIRS